jgi:predicted MFS family arabinose efflux permease
MASLAPSSPAAQQPALPRAAAIYLGVIQFFFAAMWIVYVIFLPALAEQVGIPRQWVIWILMGDQLVFLVMDVALGMAADRIVQLYGRLALPILAAAVVSCLAFVFIPFVAASAGTRESGTWVVLLFLMAVWSITSSALRAPLWVLLAKYAAAPSVPGMAALALVGFSVASAIAPYLGVTLRGVDPRLPFALSSLTVLAVTAGLIGVERLLARSGARFEAAPPPGAAGAAALRESVEPTTVLPLFLGAVGMLAVGFQVHSAFNSGPQYLRFAQPGDLEYLLPLFWVGFNVCSFPAAALAARAGSLPIMAWAGAVGAAGTLLAALAPNLALTILGQLVAGGAWGAVLTAGLAAAIGLGRSDREGFTLGVWFSVQALATLIRMALIAADANLAPEFLTIAAWAPPVLWLAGALLLTAAIGGALGRRAAEPAGA